MFILLLCHLFNGLEYVGITHHGMVGSLIVLSMISWSGNLR